MHPELQVYPACTHASVQLYRVVAAYASHILPGVYLLFAAQNGFSDLSIDGNDWILNSLRLVLLISQGELGHSHQPESLIYISLQSTYAHQHQVTYIGMNSTVVAVKMEMLNKGAAELATLPDLLCKRFGKTQKYCTMCNLQNLVMSCR